MSLIAILALGLWWPPVIPVVIASRMRWGNHGWIDWLGAACWPWWVPAMLAYWIVVATPELPPAR